MSRLQQHQEVAAYLRGLIRSGELGPGEVIPSEASLCEQFQCSRGTIRKAVSTLRIEGLVSTGQGRRTRVLGSVAAQDFDTVISFSQWCRASGFEPGQKTQWVTKRPADPEIASRLEISDGEPVVMVFRLRLIDGVPAMVERAYYPLSSGNFVLTFDTDSGSIYDRLAECDVEISHASRTIDAIAADEDDAKLLGVDVGAPLLRVRCRAFTFNGVPVEYGEDRYLPSMANFVSTAARGNPLQIVMMGGPDGPADQQDS